MNKYQEALLELGKYTVVLSWSKNQTCSINELNEFKLLQELVDKATPKKPIIETDFMFYELEMYEYIYLICPNCKSKLIDESEEGNLEDLISNNKDYYKKDYYNQDIKFCHCCGQKLDWNILDEIFKLELIR
jgi:hypothetical protein